jgi:hypothetical protein
MRFRKGKKAFKSGRLSKLSLRYLRSLALSQARRKTAISLTQAATIGAQQVAIIKANITLSPQQKAIALAQQIIHTAQGINKVLGNN